MNHSSCHHIPLKIISVSGYIAQTRYLFKFDPVVLQESFGLSVLRFAITVTYLKGSYCRNCSLDSTELAEVSTKSLDLEDAFSGIFKTAGKAIVWNAVVVIAGFLTLVFSQIPPNQKLGLVCSLGIATSLISSFLAVPVFL